MKRIGKRGSHVGVVISFVIFVTFLAFLYSILQPTTIRERDRQYVLDYLSLNLIGNATGNMTTMLVNVDEPVSPQSCVNLQQIINDDEIPEYMISNLAFQTSEEAFTYEVNSPNIRVNTGNGFQ